MGGGGGLAPFGLKNLKCIFQGKTIVERLKSRTLKLLKHDFKSITIVYYIIMVSEVCSSDLMNWLISWTFMHWLITLSLLLIRNI